MAKLRTGTVVPNEWREILKAVQTISKEKPPAVVLDHLIANDESYTEYTQKGRFQERKQWKALCGATVTDWYKVWNRPEYMVERDPCQLCLALWGLQGKPMAAP